MTIARTLGAVAPRPDALRLRVLARADCHLCDAMIEDLRYHLANRLARGEVVLDVVDVDASPELSARHGAQVPVLTADDGDAICTYRIDRPALESVLAARLPPAGPGWR